MDIEQIKRAYNKAELWVIIYCLLGFDIVGVSMVLCVPNPNPLIELIPIPITFWVLFWVQNNIIRISRKVMIDTW